MVMQNDLQGPLAATEEPSRGASLDSPPRLAAVWEGGAGSLPQVEVGVAGQPLCHWGECRVCELQESTVLGPPAGPRDAYQGRLSGFDDHLSFVDHSTSPGRRPSPREGLRAFDRRLSLPLDPCSTRQHP